jgi:hypothetical protein
MSERIFKKITVVGCSTESHEKAIEAAVRKSSESLHGLAWWEVKELRGGIGADGELEYQVTVDVAFKLD